MEEVEALPGVETEGLPGLHAPRPTHSLLRVRLRDPTRPERTQVLLGIKPIRKKKKIAQKRVRPFEIDETCLVALWLPRSTLVERSFRNCQVRITSTRKKKRLWQLVLLRDRVELPMMHFFACGRKSKVAIERINSRMWQSKG